MNGGTGTTNVGVGSREYFETFYSMRDWRRYRWRLSEVVRYAEPGPVLDLGAGMGFLVEAFQRWGLICVGIEGSQYAVEAARKRFPGIDLRCQPLSDNFPFEDGHFSAVVMNQVIEHLEPGVGWHCVAEAYRVLTPRGVLCITSPSKYNRVEIKADPTHINLYSPEELRALLEEAGFERLIEQNDPRPLLGGNWLSLRLMSLVLNVTRLGIFSDSANCVAFKPEDSSGDQRREL